MKRANLSAVSMGIALLTSAAAGFVGCGSASDAAPGADLDASSPVITPPVSTDDAATMGMLPSDAGVMVKPDATTTSGDDDDDASVDASDAGLGPEDCDAGAKSPRTLACTGLYSNFDGGVIDSANVLYDPGLHLWSDGALKRRWLRLPPGTKIDTSDMDEWTFPVGTKIWKEFSFPVGADGGAADAGAFDGGDGGDGGATTKVETRYMWKNDDTTSADYGTWYFRTYQWSADQTHADAVDDGVFNAHGTYEIPSSSECVDCHEGRKDSVLGIEAISLSQPSASGITITTLKAASLLTNPPAASYVIPGNATESGALAFLHANCGNACHNRSASSFSASTHMYMKLTVANLGTVQATDTYQTTVGVTSTFQPVAGGNDKRINAGSHATSMVWYRANFRDTNAMMGIQMPPFATHVVPQDNVDQVAAWIDSL